MRSGRMNPRAVSTQRMGVKVKAGSAQRMDADLRVVSTQRTDGNSRDSSAQRTGVNWRAEIACSNRQSLVRTRECVEDLPTTDGVLTIIGGLHKTRGSHNACDKYVKEAKNPPQALAHKTDMCPTRST